MKILCSDLQKILYSQSFHLERSYLSEHVDILSIFFLNLKIQILLVQKNEFFFHGKDR